MNDLTLVVRRTIRASRDRVFAAWTQPEHVVSWWGPAGVHCPEAHIDLRVGGQWRIANAMLDGQILWLSGEFETIDPPERLVYTWQVGTGPLERVVVRFVDREGSTEITVQHERIADPPTRDAHQHGWNGCLDGLDGLLTG